MIIFAYDMRIIPYIEQHCEKKAMVANMSSIKSGLVDLTPLITRLNNNNISGIPMNQFIDSLSFDMYYADMLKNDPVMHRCLLKLIMNSFNGELIVVLVGNDWYRNAVTESLIKYIQQVYGHNCWIIEDLEDIEYISECGFTPMGLTLISEQMEELSNMYLNQKETVLPDISLEEVNCNE